MSDNSQALTPKQRAFVAEYLVDKNATQAAIRAGYNPNSANEQAARLLAKDSVSQAVKLGLEAQFKRAEISADTILRELLLIATVDLREAYTPEGVLKPISEMPEGIAKAIASYETDELFLAGSDEKKLHAGFTRKLKLWDKPKALELLGKYLKLFTDKVEIDVSDKLALRLETARQRAKLNAQEGGEE